MVISPHGTLKNSPRAKTDKLAVADDDVVEHRHAHQFARLFQTAGDLPVFPARRRVAGRMVVDQDDGGGGVANRRAENLPRMNDALVEGTILYLSNYVLLCSR